MTKFKPIQSDTRFNPSQISDNSLQLKQEYAKEAAAEEKYLSQLQANEKINIKNAEKAGRTLEELSKFSKTITDALVVREEEQNKKEMELGIADFYEENRNNPDIEAAIEQDIGEESLIEADTATQGYAAAIQKNGGDREVARNVRNSSGWRAYGRAIAAASNAAAMYEPWLKDQMANNTTMQFTDPTTGKTFTPAEAKGRAQKAAAMSILRTNFFNEHGMGNYSKQLLAKYAFQKMYDVDNKIMAASLKQDDINSSFQEQTQITSAFETNKDLGGFIHSLSTTVDEDGNPLGMQGAWKYAMNHIKKMVLAGNLSIPDLEVIREQAMPGMGGKTFGELHATKFDTIVLEVTRAKQTRFSMMQQEAKNEWLTREAEIIAALGPNPTIEEIELGNEALLSVPGWSRRSASLDQIASTLSVDAKQRKKQRN